MAPTIESGRTKMGCTFHCPAGGRWHEGTWVPCECEGENLDCRRRLRDHMTRYHTTNGDRSKVGMKQFDKNQIVNWFELWANNQWSNVEGWTYIFTAACPELLVPPPFKVSLDKWSKHGDDLTTADMQAIGKMAFRDYPTKLPEGSFMPFKAMMDMLRRYLEETGGETTGDVKDSEAAIFNARGEAPAGKHTTPVDMEDAAVVYVGKPTTTTLDKDASRGSQQDSSTSEIRYDTSDRFAIYTTHQPWPDFVSMFRRSLLAAKDHDSCSRFPSE